MQRKCAVCGNAFEAQRPQAKYCGPTCRQRAHRSGPAVPVVQIPAADGERAQGLIEVVEAELKTAGRLNTVAGQHALELARRIVHAPGMNTGVAALSKQLQAVLAEALSGTQGQATDPIDELRARRDAKRRGTA